jgi:hypothetical protein
MKVSAATALRRPPGDRRSVAVVGGASHPLLVPGRRLAEDLLHQVWRRRGCGEARRCAIDQGAIGVLPSLRYNAHLSMPQVVMRDRVTRKPRGFGFVTFKAQESASLACKEAHIIDGRSVSLGRSWWAATSPRRKMRSCPASPADRADRCEALGAARREPQAQEQEDLRRRAAPRSHRWCAPLPAESQTGRERLGTLLGA